MLGDAYGAAVVAAMSKKELAAMDEMNEKIKEEEEDNKKKIRILSKEQVGMINYFQDLELTDIINSPPYTFNFFIIWQ